MAELMDRETAHILSRRRSVFGALALLALLLACTDSTRSPAAASRVTIGSIGLTDGWALRAADEVTDPGDTIATVGYPTTGWNPVTLPSTVLAGLVADGVYPDIYRGTNLADVPDLTKQQWWYRGEFDVPPAGAGQRVWLRFEGISYRAQIWMNGVELDPMPRAPWWITSTTSRMSSSRAPRTPSPCSSRRRVIAARTFRSAPSTGTLRRRT